MWTVQATLFVLVSLLGVGAGVPGSNAVAAAAAPGSQDAMHEVMPGDNLHLIAGYYYGDARQWERIWRANRDQVPNPNRLQRGTLLRIPEAEAPAEPYPDFVARARRAETFPGPPGQAEGSPASAPAPAASPAPRP